MEPTVLIYQAVLNAHVLLATLETSVKMVSGGEIFCLHIKLAILLGLCIFLSV